MRLVLLLLCAFTSISHAAPQIDPRQQIPRYCLPLPQGRTVELAGDVLYALHDGGFGYNSLFVIELRPQPKLVARVAFTGIARPSALYVDGRYLHVVGTHIDETRVVKLDVSTPAAPKLVDRTPAGQLACAPPQLLPLVTSATAGELSVRAVKIQRGLVLELRRPGQPTFWIDHAALVTQNYWELVRWLNTQGACRPEPQYACGEANLRTQLRTSPYELVFLDQGLLYSLSLAGLAVHDPETLKLVAAVRWPTMQAAIGIQI